MDPEQTFLRVHARLSGMLSQLLTPKIRLALEYLYFAVAVVLFCLLVVMHTNFVQQPGCSSEFTGIEFTEAQLVQIKITGGGLWTISSNNINHSPPISPILTDLTISSDEPSTFPQFWSRSKVYFKSWQDDQSETPNPGSFKSENPNPGSGEELGKRVDEYPLSSKESFQKAVKHLIQKWYVGFVNLWRNGRLVEKQLFQLLSSLTWRDFLDISWSYQLFHARHLKSFLVHWLERRSKAFEPTYLYSVEKGYFLLSEGAKAKHGVKSINITISAQHSCFGNRWQQLLINSLVGYDTILTNSLLNSPGQGYLYNFQTKEFYDLSYGHEPPVGPTRFGDYFVTKCGVLIMSLFVFFTTTMSVSFTLRETQSRMLKFTVQLQHHARHRLPTFQLIFVHVIESLVFVPIMIGILFFLFEFYDDQMLAFLVLTLVWLCELFTMISVRTSISMQFFPRFFLLYFLVFHIYFFSYSYGFSYLAFSATAAFMQHLILYFWNRFEVPALQRFLRTRANQSQQSQQSGVHIATLHIARVSRPDPPTEPGSNPPQTGSNNNNPLNNRDRVGSLLLWLLGGGDGIVSFFSGFRDVRDHQTLDDNRDNREESEVN